MHYCHTDIFLLVRPNITEISLNNGQASIVHNGQAGPVEEFKGLSLICSATGKPTPRILWLRDGIVLADSSRHAITSSSGITTRGELFTTSTLMVSKLMLADNGTYTCRAVSGNVSPIPGQTAWVFQLDVRRESLGLYDQCICYTIRCTFTSL